VSQDPVDIDRYRLPYDGIRLSHFQLHDIPHQTGSCRTAQECSRRCTLLQHGRKAYHVANHGVGSLRLVSNASNRDRSGMQTHANGKHPLRQRRAPLTLLAHMLLYSERCQYGPLGVIFLGRRRTKHRQNVLTRHVLHGPAIAVDFPLEQGI
jgi:hypothetical protein